MTKKELVWRLKERPTTHEITELVRDKIITNEEARQLLFSDKEPKDASEENKALKEQIEFLQETINKLMDKLSAAHTVWTYYEKYLPTYPVKYWYSGTDTTWMNVNASNNTVQLSAGNK